MEKIYLRNAAIVKKVGDKLFIASEGEGVYDEKTVIAEGTTVPRELRHRFADVVNVKDFGAKGDGMTDDTAAFAAAIATGKQVFVPYGVYDVRNIPTRMLFGFGKLTLSSGQTVALSGLESFDDLCHKFIAELNLSSGKVPQDCSICGDSFFVSQQISGTAWGSDAVVRISEFRRANLAGSLESLRPDEVAADAAAPVASCEFTGFGHGEGVQAIREDGQVYLYTQLSGNDGESSEVMNFAKVAWNGAESTYQEFRGLSCAKGQIAVSSDGKYLLVCANRASNGRFLEVWVFDRAEVEQADDISSVKPVHQWKVRLDGPMRGRSGLACDGRFVYVLSSLAHASDKPALGIYTLDGQVMREIPINHMASILHDKLKNGWNGWWMGWKECEGIAVDGDRLLITAKIIMAQPTSVVTFAGKTYMALSDTTGVSPGYYYNAWAPIEGWTGDAPEWSITANYTAPSQVLSHRYAVSIEHAIDEDGEYPLASGLRQKSKELTVTGQGHAIVASRNSGYVRIGTIPDNIDDFVEFARFYYNGGLQLLDPRAWLRQGESIDRAGASGAVQYDAENGSLLLTAYDYIDREIVDPETGETSTESVLTPGNVRITLFTPSARNNNYKHAGCFGTASTRLQVVGEDSPTNSGAIMGYVKGERVFFLNPNRQFVFYQPLRPATDATTQIGYANLRFSEIFAATGEINTSDAREKVDTANPNEALMRAWGKVNFKTFKFTDAVEKKGEGARIHFGVIAQQVAEAFASEGLDASRYALFCYDKWDDEYEDVEVVDVKAVLDEHGNEVTPAVTHIEKKLVTPAGDRYGIRYSEALALECAYQRWRLSKLEEKMASIS